MATKTRINLLSSDFKSTPDIRYLKTGSIAVISIYIFLLCLLFGISYFLSIQKGKLETENIALTSKINSFKKNEELVITLKNRVTVSQAANEKAGVLPADSLKKITSIIPSNIELITVRTASDGTTVLLCRATSSKAIEDFFKVLQKQSYVTTFLSSFSLGDDGNYSFSLTLN